MKQVIFAAMMLMCVASYAQPPMGGRGNGPRDGGMMPGKDSDSVFVELFNANLKKFKQYTYQDEKTGQKMDYNLFVPAGYDGSTAYPLVLFMADASTVGKEVTAPLTQGYGALEFASDRDQQLHSSFVLVPQYTTWTVGEGIVKSDEVDMTIRLLQSVIEQYNVDTDRLYTTGQSMGGMMSFYFNIAYPDMFAASLFVSCQWDNSKMTDFGTKKFFYITSAGDDRASTGQRGLAEVLNRQNARMESALWSARLPKEEQEQLVRELIERGSNINFITFEKGSTLPDSGRGMEHMTSFDFAYKLDAVRDWLFEQHK